MSVCEKLEDNAGSQVIDIDEVEAGFIDEILPWEKLLEMTLKREQVSREKILELFKKFRFQLSRPN